MRSAVGRAVRSRQLLCFVFDARMVAEAADNVHQLVLDLVELLLAAFLVQFALLQIDCDAIEVFDLVYHLVGRPAQLAEASLFRESAKAPLLHLGWRKFLRLAHRVEHADPWDSAVILISDLGRGIGKTQAPNILYPIISDAQANEILLSVDRDRPDLMVGAR